MLLLSLSNGICDLLTFGSKPVTGLLNNIVDRLSNSGPGRSDLVCNKTINMSALVSNYFFHGSFTNLYMPLPANYFDDYMMLTSHDGCPGACRNPGTSLKPQFVSASNIILLGSPYSAKNNLACFY